ncbi:MAG: type III-A CRISPR-associated protein Cas10/Csm1 [Bacillota bacterium]|nr:type III-A CRISPR-associated protein Cas10/Csm1 [Bacillota bacterium]
MEQRLVNLIIGALLHDVGKIIHRTGIMQSHSKLGWEFVSSLPPFNKNNDIKECIKYHHGRELYKAKVDDNSLAYISYIADNISAYSDRREEVIEGDDTDDKSAAIFDRKAPLSSVFNILYGRSDKNSYRFNMLKDISYPTSKDNTLTSSNYEGIKIKLSEHLKAIDISKEYINSILHLLEVTTSFVPSSTNTKELMDISFFDHSKTTAAIASCLYYYLANDNYREKLFMNEKQFKEEQAFLLYSYDISGIQNYIYTISGSKALKSLRARSLYLELLLENIVDELLAKIGLSRCNLIYTGGGHAYILLPNTEKVKNEIEEFDTELKAWFLDQSDISLYIAGGYAECSSKELAEDIGKVYERVGRAVSKRKSQRYTANDIRKLNECKYTYEERECKECKKTGKTSKEGNCNICQALFEISSKIIRDDVFFVVLDNPADDRSFATLPLPFNQCLTIKNMEETRAEDYIRVYSKNLPSMGHGFATNIWVGDYTAKINNKNPKTFENFADEAVGINRIAVLRADVDNLGKAFIFGFKEEKDGEIVTDSNRKYETISRTATLSRHLSMFFKYYINSILRDKNRNALIVYSGGDDMFIVGSWNDIIDLAGDIRKAFVKYTNGTLSISSGIGIYPHSFPISRIAEEVGELENAAKTKDEFKNKVTLFTTGKVDENGKVVEDDWVLEWDQLPIINQLDDIDEININNKDITAKLWILREVLRKDDQHGKAFLYNMLDLLRSSQNDRINIARYAYLLGRAENKKIKLNVTEFYKWIKTEKDRKELEIAMTLYSYETRD